MLRRLSWKDEKSLEDVLSTLPTTLFGTYERIFQLILEDMPADIQPVAEALSWIIYNTELLEDKMMSLRVLLAAVYQDCRGPAAPDDVLHRRKYQLQHLLGCLVRYFDVFDGDDNEDSDNNDDDELGFISLSHYSVAEFLSWSGIKSGPVASFAPQERREFCSVLLRTSIGILPATLDPHFPTRISFANHVLVSSIICINVWQHLFIDYQELYELMRLFLLPSSIHYEALTQSLEYDDKRGKELVNHSSKFWLTGLEYFGLPSPSMEEVYTLMSLLEMRNWDLAAKMIVSKGARSTLLTTKVKWRVGFSVYRGESEEHPDSLIQYGFDGTLPEWAAVYALLGCQPDCSEIFRQLCRHYLTDFAHQTPDILIAASSSHGHGVVGTFNICKGQSCILRDLIEAGAILDPETSRITPLQVAVLRRDYDAVETLVLAGANVNSTGSPTGKHFSRRNPLSYFNSLHGASPLYIHYNYEHLRHPLVGEMPGGVSVGLIEALLLERGAQEFQLFPRDRTNDCEVRDDHRIVTS